MSSPHPEINVDPSSKRDFALCFLDSEPERKALPEEDVLRPNIDIHFMVSKIFGLLPGILPCEEDLLALPGFDRTCLKMLRPHTAALYHANSLWLTATTTPDGLQDLIDDAIKTRERFRSTTINLAVFGMVDPAELEKYQGLTGYKVTAADLYLCTTVVRKHWRKLKGKCPINEAELRRAERLVEKMVERIGVRENAPITIAEATDHRDRCFTLVTRDYDEVQRGITYLRWHHGDAEVIAPSLYAGRRKGNGRDVAKQESSTQAAPRWSE